GVQAGAGDSLTKPCSDKDLLARVGSALEIARLRREALDRERRLRAVFNQQFQFMALVAPDGAVLEANDTCFWATGVARERVLGRPFWETPWWDRLPAMQERWRQFLAEVLRNGGPGGGGAG